MDNPFVYGEVVPPGAFVDRQQELDRLTGDLLAGQKVFLISPRRYGKSSLIAQALAGASRRGALAVTVTVSSYSAYVSFLEGYARALLGVETRLDRARAWLREMIDAVRPEVRFEPERPRPTPSAAALSRRRARRRETPARGGEAPRALRDARGVSERGAPAAGPKRDSGARRAREWRWGPTSPEKWGPASAEERTGRGQLAVSFAAARTERDVARLAADVFALPGRIAEARRRRLAVALDEFQAIGAFGRGQVEHALRAAIQHQRQVGYVFAGSEPSLMERMLQPRRPFYKAGPVMRLQKIPPEQFARFIESRFVRTGIRPEPGVGAAIVDLAGNLPYDVQRLAHETWDDVRAAGKRTAGVDDLHVTLKRLLVEQDTVFEALWQRLTLAQRAALRAVVLEDGRELLSADARARHRLGGPSSVQASLGALLRHDVLAREDGRYVVVDSLMREWVARKTF